MVTIIPAPATTYEKGKLYQIPITDFKPDPDQPRKVVDPDALAELAASILKYGILQPLLFRVEEGNPYLIIVAGERRFQAAQQAGLFVLPAIYVEGDHAEIALVENLQRQDLTAIEEAESLQRLMLAHNYTQEQLGDIVKKARNTISEIMLLNNLPAVIRDKCRGDRTISKNVLIEIARKKQERSMITAYDAYLEKRDKAKVSRKKGDPNDHAAALELSGKIKQKIGSIDMTAWTDDERESFRVSLVDLKNQIEGFLSPNTGLA